ncbi:MULTISPECIES: hypothetical protein [Streptomyces]|uniref:hypothetical protein n=1 Tax=Streptomyces TaxID=1883 RepID=UPI00163D18C4|nr:MULTISPECIES: hypothetical protein [Streptomyces]MBC2876908.1 hypothetical protein [Streptomyces sp. TYQ1024]UBI35935.1 hypothetical protein K7I03_05300 [Streptomyces mobaraensis]UKW28528.1 hypothetical protein MCU78_05300 [Streptomyces sp. TYQ1024]
MPTPPPPHPGRPAGTLARRSFLMAGGATAVALATGLTTAPEARATDASAGPVIHTLVFSFSDTMPADQRDAFFAEMKTVVMGSKLAESIDHKPHLRLPDDDHAPVFVSSAIAEIRCKDLPTLRRLTAYGPLNDFRTRWQARYPYKVVWTNHAPLSVRPAGHALSTPGSEAAR